MNAKAIDQEEIRKLVCEFNAVANGRSFGNVLAALQTIMAAAMAGISENDADYIEGCEAWIDDLVSEESVEKSRIIRRMHRQAEAERPRMN